MNKQLILKIASVFTLLLFVIMAGSGHAQEPATPIVVMETPLTTAFTYQGQLTQDDQPVSATCDMMFRLFDAVDNGIQVGPTINAGVTAVNGLFTVALDFGVGVFNGDGRWLDIAVQCPGDSLPVNLGRQALTATPYALYALDTASVGGLMPSDFFQLGGNNVADTAILGTSSNHGLEIRVNNQRVLGLYPSGIGPSLVAGHSTNSVSAGIHGAVISGGGNNSGPNQVTGGFGTVSGGSNNIAAGGAVVGGGGGNTASGGNAVVGGGGNNIASGSYATVAGGWSHTAGNNYATIGGGHNNTINGSHTTIGGGQANIAHGNYATIGGGSANNAFGHYATISGGRNNAAQGENSLAAGRRARALNQGCFVWGDNSNADVTCNVNNRWVARSSGGVYFYTDSALTSGVFVGAGGNAWSSVSDQALKENIVLVDAQTILAQLVELPIATWNYQSEDVTIRHLGPMAQDFYAAFSLGDSDRHISTIDADGVSLAAIQGLYELVQAQEAEIDALKSEVDGLTARMTALETTQRGATRNFSGWESLWLIGSILAGGFVLWRREGGQP